MLKRLLLTAFAVFVGYLVQAQTISGTVYKDFNGNGSRQTTAPANEPGVGGIVVNAYDATNTVIETAISASDGTYSMPFTVPVRIEFVLPTSGGCVNPDFDFTGFSGDGNNVRFVNAATSGLDYGMLSADEYVVNTDPEIFVPYYIDGDPLGGGSSGTASAFQSHNYSTSGTASPARSLQANQIGAVWGVAFSKQANQVFTAAFIKRHVGLGPMGSGGIYMLTPSGATFTVTQFYDMDANGHRTRAASSAPAFGPGSSFTLNGSPATSATYSGSIDPVSDAPEGLGVVGVNGAGGRNLNIDAGFDSNDPAAFDQVGKVGIGDIEISDDGKFLFVMNLYDRKVYRLELNDPRNPTGVVSVTSYSLPTIAVNNGVIRPFALKYHKGKIYVGAVASGEDGGQNIVNGSTDLYAYVLELNNASGSASFTSLPILSFPLNYRKGSAIQVNLGASQWYPWNKVTSNVLTFNGEQTLPTPILSDIEFTDRGDLILDFMDRSGHQYGYNNYRNLSGTASIFSYDVGGDILVAGYDCATSTFTLESNGSYTSNGTTFSGGVGNNQGPGGGEFFNQEFLPIWHNETSTGSVAVMKGDNKILLTLMDPISDFTGGSAKFSTTDGSKSGALTVFAATTAGTFGKANGLGDIELSGDEPGIEIGNRVWVDIDNDGIQDPGEIGLNDVTVELFADFDNNNIPDGAALGSVTTSSDGNYYFNPTTVIDGDPITPGNQAGPQPGKTYLVQIGSSDWSSGVGVSELLGLSLSPSNVGGAGQPDVRDNDATLMASIPSISVTTGKLGQNDHKADFGFAECVADAGPNVDLNCNTTSATIGTPAVVGNTYSWTPATGLSSSTVAQPTASPTSTTTYTLTVNGLCTDVVTVNVDNTPPSADAGSNMDLNCTTTSATIGTAAIVGNTYSWSPSTGLSSTSIAQPTASPSTTTTYTVTVTGANGCSATDEVTVNVDTTPPTADAGSNMDLNCTTTSATIGTAAIVGNTYSWSPSTGLSSTTIAQPTASPSTTTTYTVTVTGANGCSATDEVTVNVDTTPPTADAGSNMDLNCTTTSATIGTAAIVGNTYSWSPSTGLSSTAIAQPTASPSTTTTYTVTVTGTNGCSATDEVTVNVDTTPPTADAGSNMDLNCTTTSATIGTAAIVGNTYSWSPSTGLSSTSIAQPTASPSTTTTYTVTVTGANGCSATDEVTVNVDTTPPTADAGSNMDLNCTTTSATIGTAAIVGNTYSWSPSTGLSSTTIAQPTASPSTTTTYTVTVTGANGCSATDEVTVNVDTTPPTADAGSNMDLNCTTTSATIGTAAIVGNTYSWSPSTGLSSTSIAQPTASPSTTTTYTVTVTGTNGCSATDEVTVNVDTTPPTADAGNTLNLDCITNSGIIGTTAIVGNAYSWSPSTGLSSTAIAQPTASPSTTTTYTVTVTGANGCSATDEVTVNVSAGVPTADAGPAQTIDCNTSMVSIGSTAIVGNTYSWDPSSGLSATNIADPTASPAVTTTYTVTVTASSGCTATDVVTVTVDLTAPSLNISGTTTVCNGSTTVLTANGGVSWSWMPGGATSQDITVGAGTYTVTATGTNGCTSSSAITVENKEGSVGNYVWYDMNGNGVADEPVSAGINGVVVELWKESSVGSNTYLLDQTTTTLNDLGGNPGYYHFVICESANYKVKFPLTQGGQGLTDSDVTAATDNNSDANKSSGESPVFAIDVNGTGVSLNNPTIDAGYYKPAQLGNYVWHDVDEDGIQDGNEVGVAGITVTLYNSINNAVVGATVTDAYGYYKFNPLSPGSYYVGFSLPANYVFTGDDAGSDDGLDSDADEASGLTGLYTIVAGDSNMSVDAGIYVPSPVSACLGDRVWMDMNANGIQDGSELGVAGVTVTLYNNAGEPISTTITNSNGIYSFCSLTPGTYSVGFSKPIGYILSPDNQGSDDGLDSDADPITGMSSTVTLLPGDNNLSLDAGLYPQAPTTAGLGNYVWNDVNNDGIQGEIETGVAGVTVTLYGADGTTVLSTTTTDELGYYVFNNLTAGSYVVGFSNIPAGFNLTTSDQGSNDALDSDADLLSGKTPVVILAAGEFNMTLDAGIHNPGLPTAALGNYVWFDLNKNGEQDLTENGVPGVSVTLYASDGTTVLDNTVTNTLGYYLFDNLAAGSYVVGFSNIPSGYAFTTADQGNDATDSDVDLVTNKTAVTALANGEVNLTLDGGIIESSGRNNLGSLGDRVWYDDNQNGIQEVGELGTPGVTVTLYAANGTTVLGTKSTDALGNYIFTGLDAGTYVVGFSNIPGGYTFSTADQGVDDELDADADAGSGGKTDPIDLGLGEDNMSVDAGIYPASGLASLGNYVWNDLNLDGVQDANEPGVPGVSVVLYDNSGSPVASTSTDANGLYQFTGLTPAEYSVGFSNLPSGYNFTVVDAGGDDGLDSDADVSSGLTPSVTLIANQNYPDFDAGIFTLLASLGNYVWNDLDNDGIQDALEEGVPGITVTLYASDGITPISTSVTNAQGYYSFVNLIPDTYVVGFSNIPEGSQFSPSNQGSDDGLDSDVNPLDGKTSSVTLSAGEYNPTLDAGIYTPLGAGLGDYVWYDANDNGQQDASEVGVPGVTAILNDGSGSPLKSTITDANGYYTFPNLAPGVYSVSFTTLPYQRVFSVQNSGSDVSDNDVVNITLLPGGYPAMGTTGNYTLLAGEYNPTIDAGISLSVPLGVSKLQAYAVLEGNVSEVSWITVDEKNVHHFEIERSTDGSSFVQVSQKQALGNTNGQHGYSITDDVLDLMHLNLIYYRVKAVDQDGKFVYSNIVSVRPNQTETISAYPTPFTDQITIDYLSVEASEVDVVLTDGAGKVVAHQLFTTKEGQNRLLFNGLAPLASGQYYIRIVDFYTSEQFILKTMK
jgi:protocatechuate 3,4-dioxygenase beta subunit